jgi:hypothetical protein
MSAGWYLEPPYTLRVLLIECLESVEATLHQTGLCSGTGENEPLHCFLEGWP